MQSWASLWSRRLLGAVLCFLSWLNNGLKCQVHTQMPQNRLFSFIFLFVKSIFLFSSRKLLWPNWKSLSCEPMVNFQCLYKSYLYFAGLRHRFYLSLLHFTLYQTGTINTFTREVIWECFSLQILKQIISLYNLIKKCFLAWNFNLIDNNE